MKKKLRPWVVNVLIIINLLCMCVMFGDCEDDLMFFIKTMFCLFIFIFNSYTLYKLGGLNEEK